MKHFVIVAFCFSIVAFGCKKSNTDERTPAPAPGPIGFVWPTGTGPYAPYTIGSTFVYETGPTPVDSVTYTVTKDTIIAGLNYRKLQSNKENLRPTHYANYSNNTVTDIIYNYTFQGFTLPQLKQTLLKDNQAVNSTWQDILNITVPYNGLNVPVTITLSDTIKQKDYSHTVLAKSYLGSFFVKQNIGIDPFIAQQVGVPANTPINNYLAAEAGLIERIFAPGTPTTTTDRLKRANIIK
jgi:hypothetical protein